MNKSILITALFAFIATFTFAQPKNPFIDFSKYEKADSFLLEKVYVHLPVEFEDGKQPQNSTALGSGYYLFELPHAQIMTIKTNGDRTKAVVTYKSLVVGGRFEYPIGGRYEYNIEENDRRIVLWYKDDRTYCGYIYDKLIKVCKCFEERKEYKYFMRKFDLKW